MNDFVINSNHRYPDTYNELNSFRHFLRLRVYTTLTTTMSTVAVGTTIAAAIAVFRCQDNFF